MAFKKILIIEDNPQHLEEVKNFIDERVKAGADFETRFVSTFEEAKKALDTEQYDGIISDIFFPEREGMLPEPIAPAPKRGRDEQLQWAEDVGGVKLVREARTRRIPFILCTSTYHHGEKTQPVSAWLRENNADFIVDASHEIGSGEAEQKDWQRAFIELAYLRSAIDHKLFQITEGGISTSSLIEKLYEENPSKYEQMSPLLKITSRNAPYGPPAEAASEIAYGMAKGKLHTLDPILKEVLDGPGKGLVSYSSEVPTVSEILERAAKEYSFASYKLNVPEYGKERGASGFPEPTTPERWEAIARPAAEKFVEDWRDNKPKVEQAWGEWSKLSKEGIEGAETELPSMRPRDWGEPL